MGNKKAKEMRSLVLSVSASVLILLLAIIAYFMADVIITTNKNIDRNKEMVVEQSTMTLDSVISEITGMSTNAELFNLVNQGIIQDVLSGNMEPIYPFIVNFVLNLYPVDYIGVIVDGKTIASDDSGGYNVDPSEMPVEPTSEDFDVLYELGDKEGFFVSQFYDVSFKNIGSFKPMSANMILDRTEEMATVTRYFEDQRNDLVLRLSIAAGVAVLLCLLLTTFGLRYFTRKYVVKPIEDLNNAAEDIANGTFEGEVQVDEDSAYSALQGLLRSGQKVLQRMDEEMKE